MNLGELKTEIKNASNRSNETDANLANFIARAEARIARKLHVQDMEIRSQATISSEFFAFPDDAIKIVDIELNSSPTRNLRFLAASQMDEKIVDNTVGIPIYYSVVGRSIQVRPIPEQSYTAEIIYRARFVPLTADAQTNWVLTYHEDIYLDACLYESEKHYKNPKANERLASFNQSVADLNRSEMKLKYSGRLARQSATSTP